MVVSRRAPAAPVPASRTNSSNPVLRAKKAQVPNVSSPVVNGGSREDVPHSDSLQGQADDTESSSKKGKKKSKDKRKKDKKSRRGSGFIDLLTRIFLLWFTIYTLAVCPTDEHLKSPVCRGLHEYRRLVLEPYVLPAFHRALSHPSVAPYVERVQPYAERAVGIAKPIALRTQSEINNRIVPQWNKRVVPQINKRIVPLWNKHAAPHIQRLQGKLEPYRAEVVYEYQHRVEPHLRVAVNYLQKWQRQAQPYVILTAQKTYSGYQKVKPYAIPVWEQIKALLSRLAQLVAVQRRQYVDPHVKKIWERVIELSGGKPIPVVKTQETPASKVSRSLSSASSFITSASQAAVGSATSVLPKTIMQSESLSTSISSSSLAQATEGLSSVASVVLSSAQDTASEVVNAASSVISSVTASDLPSTASLAHESIVSPVSSVASQVDSSAKIVASSASSLTEQIRETVSAASSSVSDAMSSATATVSAVVSSGADDDLDLEAFYAELGLGDDPLAEPTELTEAPPPVQTETEEEIAERKRLRQIETANKRADITGRHAEWERQLEEAINTGRKALRKALVALRKAAAAELKENIEIRKELESLEEDAEKYLKGAEKYLANLRREGRPAEEKKALWAKVVSKVDDKFVERLGQAETVVNGWYNAVLNKELEEVKKVTEIARDIADRGQTDIGLDYAYLDDVTYQDWQRYHDLARRSENFTEQCIAIQNGSHPSPPINPVLTGIEELQNEVQDVVLGFETRLRRINRHGERSFSAKEGQDPIDEEIVLDETVSILPIEDDAHKAPEDGESSADIPPVFIGRSKEEVVAALNRVAEQQGKATSAPEDESKSPESVVEEVIAHAVEDQTHTSSTHEEL